MIKPKILSDKEIVNAINSFYGDAQKAYVSKCLKSDRAIAQAQNDYDWEEMLRQFKAEVDKLTVIGGKDWEVINKKAGADVLDIVVNLDNRYSRGKQAELIVKRCNLSVQAQLQDTKKQLLDLMERDDANI